MISYFVFSHFRILLVPYKEKEITKLYYSIGEVSAMFSVNNSLIRFWEKEFDIIKPKKNKKGNRMFTPVDVENFHLIFQCLIYFQVYIIRHQYTFFKILQILLKVLKK